MTVPHNPRHNHLIASLPAAEFKRLSPHLELVPMPLGESYYESGGKLQHVYFPTTSIVSLLYVMESGAHAEIASVGNEGMLGVSLFMGEKALPRRAFVRTVGYGYRLKARLLLEEFNRVGPMQRLLLSYTKAMITQASQIAVCNRYHSVEQKLCRCLLLTIDRMSSNELVLTQELLAGMIGGHRADIAEALSRLQQGGLISYRRGHITVHDRSGLENHACDCYGVVKTDLGRLRGADRNWMPKPESVVTRPRASEGVCAQV